MKWCIAMVDFKQLESIGPGLSRLHIRHQLGIPVVTILRKRFKNKEHFEKIPLMFNYGFIKLPNKVTKNRDKLMNIRDNVPGIFSWLFKNGKDGCQVEIVDEAIVNRLMTMSNKISVFSKSDLKLIKSGDLITLKGYPFEGLQAEVKHINEKTNKVKVNLFIMEAYREVVVDFENIFYSIYSNFDESVSHNSIDAIENQFKNSFDRFQRKRIGI